MPISEKTTSPKTNQDTATAGAQKNFWEILPSFWNSQRLRPIPSPTVRGSLFGLIKRGRHEVLENLEVYSDKNIIITYSGMSLGQADLDVWMYILQKAGQRFTDPSVTYLSLEFQITQFLTAIGRKGGKSGRPGGRDKEWLLESLHRISSGTITVKTPSNERGIVGSLITQAYWDVSKNKLIVDVNSKLGYLFSAKPTLLSVDVRTSLIGDDLALWLYNFITSHKDPYNNMIYGIDTIMKRCRTQTKEHRKFKHRLAEKMERLMAIDEKDRNFHSWVIDGNNLVIFFSKESRARREKPSPVQLTF